MTYTLGDLLKDIDELKSLWTLDVTEKYGKLTDLEFDDGEVYISTNWLDSQWVSVSDLVLRLKEGQSNA